MGSGDANRSGRVDRPEVAQVKGYRIDMDQEKHAMQIVFFDKDRKALAALPLASPAAYDFAHDVLKKYDILEGIDAHGHK